MRRFSENDMTAVEDLRTRLMGRQIHSVAEAAQAFVEDFAQTYAAVVLARVFLVLPYELLPPAERAAAERIAKSDARLGPKTRVLSLQGTHGKKPAWCDRQRSKGHLAIPLLDRAFAQGIPMIARLLSDLQVDFAGLDDGRPIASQRMLGGLNGKFYVPDAQTAVDAQARSIIPARDFVKEQDVHTVFGMGGAYVDGTLAVAVIFTSEQLDTLWVDRFPSLISNFKMATAKLMTEGKIFGA